MNDIKSSVYAQKVELLLRLIPIVMEKNVFAIHQSFLERFATLFCRY